VYCGDCEYAQSQNQTGDPVNTHTGSMSLPVEDLGFSTTSGALSFERTYISSAMARYISPLGYGWSHNQDIRLIFSSEPGGIPGYVYFKSPSGNLYRFWVSGDGRYFPFAGITSTLTKNSGKPVTYTLLDQSQNQYVFDQQGKLATRADAFGNTLGTDPRYLQRLAFINYARDCIVRILAIYYWRNMEFPKGA
jgi:hypothetical protein